MLFHVIEWKALCCPKDMSALDDLVHDSVYCLQLSLVLQALRLFPWLLRFPRREKPCRCWTLLCLQHGREAKRSRSDREDAITHILAVSGCVHHSAGFVGKGGGDRHRVWLPMWSFPHFTPALPSHPSPESGLVWTQGFPFVSHSCHPTAK